MKKDILINMDSLEKKLSVIKKNAVLKNELLGFIKFVKESKLESLSFDELTQIIKQFSSYSGRISYHWSLILESDLDIYVLINNVIFLFVELVENNSQIRGIAVNTTKNSLTDVQRERMAVQLDRIDNRVQKLDFNLFLLEDPEHDRDLKKVMKI